MAEYVEYDAVVGRVVAGVVSGGNTDIAGTVSVDGLLDLERQAFLGLV